MSKKLFIFFSLAVLLSCMILSCGKRGSSEIEIKGKIENISDKYFLLTREYNDTLVVDTVMVDTEGVFKLRVEVDTLTLASIYFNNKTKYSYLTLEKGANVEIKGDANYPHFIDIQGGLVNGELTAFRKQNRDLMKRRMELYELLVDTTNIVDSLDLNKNNDRFSELTNINFDISNIAADYVKANPTKISSVLIINAFFRDDTFIPRLDECLELLRGEAATFYLASELKAYSDKVKKSQEGIMAPYFSRDAINGKGFSLSSLRNQYVLLTFVSTTSPSYEEMSDVIKEMYADLKEKKENIEFVTIFINTEEKPVSDEDKKSMKWVLIPEKGGWSSDLLDSYNIKELPYNILISPKGTILKRNVPAYVIVDTYRELAEKNNINK